MTILHIAKMVALVAIPVAVGMLSGYLTRGQAQSEWFLNLKKPSFYPPPVLFPIVWSILYLLMGIGLYLVVSAPDSGMKWLAIGLFAVQLTANFFWSLIFFNWHQLGWALADIIVLDVLVMAMIGVMFAVSAPAALLQIPYMLWILFATALTYAIYRQ